MPMEMLHLDQLETPAVVVDLNVLEANIARFADYAQRHRLHLRPHTKTHKSPAIAQMQVASGSHGITVAKTGEAEVMADAGLDNILLAYPIFGEKKLGRLATLALKKKITVAVDSAVTAEAISRAARTAGSTFDVLVELDVGMRRCGVASAEEAEGLARIIDTLSGVRFAGLNLYPGHVLGSSGRASGASAGSIRKSCRGAGSSFAQRTQLRGSERRQHPDSAAESPCRGPYRDSPRNLCVQRSQYTGRRRMLARRLRVA